MGNEMREDDNEQVHYTYEDGEKSIENLELQSFDIKDEEQPKPISKANRRKILIVGALVLICLVVAIFVGIRAMNKHNREKYTIVLTEDCIATLFDGNDGFGTAHVQIRNDIFEEIAQPVFEKKTEFKNNKRLAERQCVALWESLRAYISPNENLSNGDLIEIEIEVDEDVLDEMGVHIENTKFTIEVTGLRTVEDFDPFTYIDIYAINYDERLAYRAHRHDDLPYGFTISDFECSIIEDSTERNILVKISDAAVKAFEENYTKLEYTEKIYSESEVESKFLSSYDDMDEELKEGCQNYAIMNISEVYANYGVDIILNNVEYYGGWIATYESTGIASKLVEIYELQVSNILDTSKMLTLYVRYEHDNMIVDFEGSGFMIMNEGLNMNNYYTMGIGDDTVTVVGCDDLNTLLSRELLSSTRGFVTFDPDGKIQDFWIADEES